MLTTKQEINLTINYADDDAVIIKSGIYRITNLVTLKSYIGRAQDFGKRWDAHYNKLKTGKHENKELQLDYDMYCRDMDYELDDVFEFEVVERVRDLNYRELYWIFKEKRENLNGIYNVVNAKDIYRYLLYRKFIDEDVHIDYEIYADGKSKPYTYSFMIKNGNKSYFVQFHNNLFALANNDIKKQLVEDRGGIYRVVEFNPARIDRREVEGNIDWLYKDIMWEMYGIKVE